MAEQVIISPSDIREFYPQLSTNIDDANITPLILLAQQNDLEPFLGWYLYHDFIEDYNGTAFVTPKYLTLFDGESYTYRTKNRYFRGIRHLLSVYSFIRLLESSDIVLTDSGLVYKETEESQPKEDYQVRHMMRKIKDDSIRLERDADDYLRTKQTDYQLYTKVYSTSDQKTSYNFYKV